MFEGFNVIYDSSLRNYKWFTMHFKWIKKIFTNAKIIIIHIDARWINVLERNIIRSELTNRFIKLDIIKQVYIQCLKSYNKLKKKVDMSIKIYNNSENQLIKNIKNIKI